MSSGEKKKFREETLRMERRAAAVTEGLSENIRSADGRTNHPELYTAPAQPAAEDEVADFLYALVRLLKPDSVLETGTAFGHTAARICDALTDNGVGELLTMEAKASRHEAAAARLADEPAVVLHAKYQDVTPPDGTSFGLCFFDATRNSRDKEFLHFRPWIADDAILVFHDTGAQHPGMSGVRALEDAGLIKSLFFATPRGISVGVPT
jgi:predicted O-methyltransferase YrrM